MSDYLTTDFIPRYYRTASGNVVLSAYEIEQLTGINPDVTGINALNAIGVYPYLDSICPGSKLNPDLYSIASVDNVFDDQATDYTFFPWLSSPEYAGIATDENGAVISQVELPEWWGQAGSYVQESLTYAPRTLTTFMRRRAKGMILRKIFYAIKELTRRLELLDDAALVSGEGNDVTTEYWSERIRSRFTEFSTLSTAIDAAADADALNNLISPAWGALEYTTNGTVLGADDATQILSADFTRIYSNSYAETDFELYFPGNDTTVAYQSGVGFGVMTIPTNDNSVELRVASTGVVVDTFIFDFNAIAGEFDFGYRKWTYGDPKSLYLFTDVDEENLLQEARRFFMLNRALFFKGSFFDEVTVDENARLTYDNNLTKVQNIGTSTGITIGADIVLGATGKVDLGGSVAMVASALVDAADDTAAAAAGVDVNGVYRTGSVLKIRVA